MKICYDTLEKYQVFLHKDGILRCRHPGSGELFKLHYHSGCETCSEPFLGDRKDSRYCCISCSRIGVNNPMYGYKGRLSPKWNSNLTDEERLNRRNIFGYGEWRSEVYERDNYTCQICGDSRGGNLIGHHLNAYTHFPKQRTEVSNGVTVCKRCHDDFHHQYGYGENTEAQFEEFSNNTNYLRRHDHE